MKLFKMKNLIAICSLSLLMGACVLEDASSTEVSNQLDENQEVGETSGVEDDSLQIFLDESFTMKVGDTFEYANGNMFVTLDSIVQDSRCPVADNVKCRSEGDVKVLMLIDVDGEKSKVVMSPSPNGVCLGSYDANESAYQGGFALMIESVDTEKPIEGLAQKDYQVSFNISSAIPDLMNLDKRTLNKITTIQSESFSVYERSTSCSGVPGEYGIYVEF